MAAGATAYAGDAGGAGPSPSQQVTTELFRALVVLRLVVTVYALVLNAVRFEEFARPGLAALLMVVLVGWTGFVSWAYDAPRRRRPALYLADVLVAVLLLLGSALTHSQAMLERQAATLPSFWVMCAVLACAVGRPWPQAVAAAVVMSVADVSVRSEVTGTVWGNIFLLLLAAGIVAYAAAVLRRAVEMQAAAERAAASSAERHRLSRAVHDGVLQVLALVQRQGQGAGPDTALARLGRLAGDQESALRALVQSDARAAVVGAQTDLVAALDALRGGPATTSVTVAGPGTPVRLPSFVVDELVAVVSACLDNVRRHVGTDAPAWVLVEDLGGAVVVTVRDEGAGIPAGRLREAAAEGRLGVSGSICGRMRDLGGRAELVTGPGVGTEWELHLDRTEPAHG